MSLSLLNLGCGSFIHDDWVNVDFVSHDKRVIAHNLLNGIPFDANTFDAVYHSHVLEHFPKDKALSFVAECHRVLKPGGWLRVVVPDFVLLCREYLKWLELAYKGDEQAKLNYEWIMLEMLDQIVRNEPGGEMARQLRQNALQNRSFIEERIGIDVIDRLQSEIRQSMTKKIIKRLVTTIWGRLYNYYRIGKFRMSGENHQWMYDRYSISRLLSESGFDNIQIKTANDSNILNYEAYSLDMYKDKTRGLSSMFIEAQKF